MDYEDARDTGPDFEASHLAQESAFAAIAAAKAGAVPLLPDAANVVILPAGTTLDDIHVSGRDLVIQLADGRVFVIPDGAVFVPQIVIDGIAVPPLNLAALLIGEQPQPAAGPVQSSGGNFADPNAPIQDAFNLGNLLPYTEFGLAEQPRQEVVLGRLNTKPAALFVTPDNLLGAIAATSSVNEAGLPARGVEPQGSNAAADSEITTGTILFEARDGLRSITLNGVEITGVGQNFTTPRGVLTITSAAPGSFGYRYTLTDNTSGDTTSDDFQVAVTDTDGEVAVATLSVRIVDDTPTARNDTDTVPAGTFGPATGNVITADGTTSAPGGADTVGADNATLTRIASNNVPANVDTSFDASGDLVVDGQYGVLSIKADGSYSYVRNANTPGGVDEVFTYTLTDGDGDTATATLTIAIGDAAPAISNLTPKASGGDVLVDEDDLSDGSDTAKESLTATGTFTLSSPDGVGSLSVDGHTVVSNGVFTAASWTTPLGNTIAITGYNAATGVVTYTYALLDNENHPANAGENPLFEDFAVVLTDLDGDSASDTLTAKIVDDVPTARNDTDTVPNSAATATGNVITGLDTTSGNAGADTRGADGALVNGFRAGTSGNFANTGTTVTGQFGTLTLNANGGYTYTRNANAPGGSTDVFSYRLADGDGDTSIATLSILIPDRPAAVTSVPTTGGSTTVDEEGLPTRGEEPEGTNQPATVETTSGTITFSTPDGFGSLAINGTAITGPGQVIVTPKGTFTVTSFNPAAGTLGYSYTLTDNTSGDSTTDVFTVTVIDTDGDTDTKPFTITIIDDVPIPRADTDNIAAGSYGPATGNVFDGTEDAVAEDANGSDGVADTPGADGASVVGVAAGNTNANLDNPATLGTEIPGLYGKLTILNAQGDYTYTRNEGSPGNVSDVFTYTLKDGDGDLVHTTLTIVIGNSRTTLDLPDGEQGGTLVFEAGLPPRGSEPAGSAEMADGLPNNNSNSGEFTNGIITYTAPDVPPVIRIDNVVVTGVIGQTFAGAHGTLEITSFVAGSIGYRYTLTDNTSGNATFDDFVVRVTDADGDFSEGTLIVNIIDDIPTATNDSYTQSAEGASVTGNVTVNDVPGADGPAAGGPVALVGGSLTGTGLLTLNPNGSFTYVPGAGEQGTVTFQYTYTDGDTDFDPATVTITLLGDSVPRIGTPSNLTVDEDGLANANVDDAPLATGETNSTESASQSGTVVVNFGQDVPAPADLLGFDQATRYGGTRYALAGPERQPGNLRSGWQ